MSAQINQTILLLSHQRQRFALWLTVIPNLKLHRLRQIEELEKATCPEHSIVFLHLNQQASAKAWIERCLQQQSHVIVVSDNPIPEEGIELFKLGIKGYIASDMHPKNVKQVVDVIAQGNVWLGHSVMSALIETAQQEKPSHKPIHDEWKQGLTMREIETAEAILQGKTNKEIADSFFVTERTVKSHVHNLLEKFQVKDRLALVLKIQAIRHPE